MNANIIRVGHLPECRCSDLWKVSCDTCEKRGLRPCWKAYVVPLPDRVRRILKQAFLDDHWKPASRPELREEVLVVGSCLHEPEGFFQVVPIRHLPRPPE